MVDSRLTHLECPACSSAVDADRVTGRCACGGKLLARYDTAGLDLDAVRRRPPVRAAARLVAAGRLREPVVLYNTGSALEYLDDLVPA